MARASDLCTFMIKLLTRSEKILQSRQLSQTTDADTDINKRLKMADNMGRTNCKDDPKIDTNKDYTPCPEKKVPRYFCL